MAVGTHVVTFTNVSHIHPNEAKSTVLQKKTKIKKTELSSHMIYLNVGYQEFMFKITVVDSKSHLYKTLNVMANNPLQHVPCVFYMFNTFTSHSATKRTQFITNIYLEYIDTIL